MNMTLGSHSHSHVALRPLDDRRLSDELRRSRAILEDIVQQPIEHVSFPGGSYDDRVLRSAVEAGYRYCHTSDWGVNRGRQIRRRVLRRTAVVNHYDTADLDALLTLRHYYLRQLGFQAKELTKSTLGVDRYVGLRQAFLSMLK